MGSARRSRSIGSSPLARGLHGDEGKIIARVGIIPARAGFTFSHTPTYPHAEDHPRSRGVYQAMKPALPWAWGSSPLARGLPIRDPHLSPLMGIIPARAGFTFLSVVSVSGEWDHPRSRGVY